MPFPGISFWVVCARISALQSISISMNLGMDCCKVTETSKSPPYNTCFSSCSAHVSSPHPRAECPAQAVTAGTKIKPEGEQGRVSVSLLAWTASVTVQPKTDYQEHALRKCQFYEYFNYSSAVFQVYSYLVFPTIETFRCEISLCLTWELHTHP